MDYDVKDSTPRRYVVGRIGTPDPANSQYYVLDVVNDYQARAQLRGLVRAYRLYGSSAAADELEKLLDDTAEAFEEAVRQRAEKLSSAAKRARR